MRLVGCLVVLVLLGSFGRADARPGVLDPSFGGNGIVTAPSSAGAFLAVVAQSDGKVVGCGKQLVRYERDGRIDTSYGAGGVVSLGFLTPGWVEAVLLPGDGLLVGTGAEGIVTIARFDVTGTLDPSFGVGGIATLTVLDDLAGMAVQADGTIVLGGGPGLSAARLHPDGTLDATFGVGGVATNVSSAGSPRALAIEPNGGIVVGGTYPTPDRGDVVLTRFDAQGTVDHGFGTDGVTITDLVGGSVDILTHLLVQDDGIVAIGRAIEPPTRGFPQYWVVLARYVNGVLDRRFSGGISIANFLALGGGGSELPWDAAIDSHGNIVVAGDVNLARAQRPMILMRFLPSGSLDASFGTGGRVVTDIAPRASAYAVATTPDDGIVLAGDRSEPNAGIVARYFGGPSPTLCPEAPDPHCATLPAGGTALLALASDPLSADTSDRVSWQWSGRVASTFGDPTSTEGYGLCVYREDESWPPLRWSASVDAGGSCRGKPCWKATGGGFKYADAGAPSGAGITGIVLKQSGGKTKLALKGRGAGLGGLNLFPLVLPLTTQLRATDGSCWTADFSATGSGPPATNKVKLRRSEP